MKLPAGETSRLRLSTGGQTRETTATGGTDTVLANFGRFDIAAMYQAFGVLTAPVWCTKIASKMMYRLSDLESFVREVETSDSQTASR